MNEVHCSVCVCARTRVCVCVASWVGLKDMETLDEAGRSALSGGMIKLLYLCATFAPVYMHLLKAILGPLTD